MVGLTDQAFIRALERIPEQLRNEGLRFCQILSRQKTPVGQAWNASGGANYAYKDPKLGGWLYEGHNYGVCTGFGGLVVVDIDDPVRLEKLGNLAKLSETFTVRTGRGGYHYYYICPELSEKVIFHDPELLDSDNEPAHLGEIQAQGQQVVGPGSVHPNGNRYEIINPAQVAEISKDALMASLDGLKLSGSSESRGEERRAGNAGAGGLIRIDDVCWPVGELKRSGAEVKGGHPTHGSTTGENFCINTEKGCWHCFRHGTGGGPLEWLAVEAGLIRCEDSKPGCLDDKALFVHVLDIAREKGYQIPDKAKMPTSTIITEPTVIDAVTALMSVCDGAHSKDGVGFNKFDRGRLKPVIEKVMAGEHLSLKDENRAHYALKKYSKQLATLGINYDNMGIIERGSGNGGGDKETQSTLLVRLVEGSEAELWHTPSREPYVTVNVSGHLENYLLGSQAARDWISRLFYQEQEKSPANQSLYDALGVLRGKALFDGPEYQIHCRLAGHDGRIYIDLGRPDWEAVEVSPEGWRIVKQPPVKFIRPAELQPMPFPESGGTWNDLRALVNAREQDTWILMVSWLVQAFWPGGPYAHLVLIGEQGSIKTSVSKTLIDLAGPSKGSLGKKPTDAQSLLIRASWNRVIGFDNLSGVVDSWFSDTLCGLSTGTAIGQRKLYTDFDQVVLEVKRPALLNGIDVIIPRGDLADRAIILELLPVESRVLAGEIEAKFQAAWPRIFALLLDATVEGLRNAGMVDLSNLPRMADFAAWVMACEPALPWKPGEFMAAYARNREGRALEQVMIDPFARTIYEMVQGNSDSITATPSNFLVYLELKAGYEVSHSPGWPNGPSRLGMKLRRIAPILRSVGVVVEIARTNKERMIRVFRADQLTAGVTACDSSVTANVTAKSASSGDSDGCDSSPLFESYKKGEEDESRIIEDVTRRKVKNDAVTAVTSVNDRQAPTTSEVTASDGKCHFSDSSGRYVDSSPLPVGSTKNIAVSTELRSAVEELERTGHPVVPFSLGQRLRRPLLGGVVQELKLLGYRETKEKDPASNMPLWRRAEA